MTNEAFAASLRSAISGHSAPRQPLAQADEAKLVAESAAEWTTKPKGSVVPRRFAKAPEVAPKATAPAAGKPATEKQFAFLRSLLAERAGVEAAEILRATMNKLREEGTFGSREASASISALMEISKAPRITPAPPKDYPQVVNGDYAVENAEGVLQFYTVEYQECGDWAGWTFVKVHASDERHKLNTRTARDILIKIAADPEEASRRYGRETEHCGRCGKKLTKESSRIQGMGDTCLAKGF